MVAQCRHTPVRKAFLPWSHGTPVPLLHHFCRQFSSLFAHLLGMLHNMRFSAGYAAFMDSVEASKACCHAA